MLWYIVTVFTALWHKIHNGAGASNAPNPASDTVLSGHSCTKSWKAAWWKRNPKQLWIVVVLRSTNLFCSCYQGGILTLEFRTSSVRFCGGALGTRNIKGITTPKFPYAVWNTAFPHTATLCRHSLWKHKPFWWETLWKVSTRCYQRYFMPYSMSWRGLRIFSTKNKLTFNSALYLSQVSELNTPSI